MDGFYAIYYTGTVGYAAFGILLKDGCAYAVDPTGGEITGTYAARSDGGIDLELSFAFQPGQLVTGQTITQPMSVPAKVSLVAATLAGSVQAVDLPIGRVNVRIIRKVAL